MSTANSPKTWQFTTLFLARVHRKNESIEWVRAGHEPALLYRRAQNAFVALRQGGGAALGLAADSIYRSRSQPIQPGDILFIGTDGITESRNLANELFGKRRLRDIIRANADGSAKSIALTIVDAVEAFRGTSDQEDDLTLVVIKVEKIP
jgi:sigma-B regulation protein RsbU (phosphoserine phosphatase)